MCWFILGSCLSSNQASELPLNLGVFFSLFHQGSWGVITWGDETSNKCLVKSILETGKNNGKSWFFIIVWVGNIMTPVHSLCLEGSWNAQLKETTSNYPYFFARGMKSDDTADGRNPAPPGIYKSPQTMGYLPYQLVQDFFHHQYHCRSCKFQGGKTLLGLVFSSLARFGFDNWWGLINGSCRLQFVCPFLDLDLNGFALGFSHRLIQRCFV